MQHCLRPDFAATTPSVTRADDAFAGKTITIVVGYAAGGGYDAYARLAADHLGKFLPGHPAVIVENMEGGGGRRSEVFLATAAPKDGTVMSIVPNSFAADSAQKLIEGDVDARAFGFIGRLVAGSDAELTWKTSQTKNFQDAMTRETIVGADGVGGNSSTIPRVLNALFGTRFKIVEGYKGTADTALAMQRGEVEGMIMSLQNLKALHPEWLEPGAVNFLWVQAPKRYNNFPDVPALVEFATNDEQRAILNFLCGNSALGRSLTTPPGVPAEILQCSARHSTRWSRMPTFRLTRRSASCRSTTPAAPTCRLSSRQRWRRRRHRLPGFSRFSGEAGDHSRFG